MMNHWAMLRRICITLFFLTLTACSASTSAAEPTQTLPETNPFDQPDADAVISPGGYSGGIIGIDPLKDNTLTYEGEPIQISYFLQGSGSSNEVGMMLFLDGVAQPYQVIKNTQQDAETKIGQEVLMSKFRVSSDNKIEYTISFTPVTGVVGDELGLMQVNLFEPSYVPENENKGFGLYNDGKFYLPLTVIMKKDAPQIVEKYFADIETAPIPQSEIEGNQSDLNPSGRISQPNFNLYSGEFSWSNPNLVTQNGQIDLSLSIWGGIEADYRATIFINHQPISIEGHPNILMGTKYDKISTYKFTLDVHDYQRMNTLYAVIIPVGQSYKNSDIYGTKTNSVLLINDMIATSVQTTSSLPAPASTSALVSDSNNIAGDRDLTFLLSENNVLPKFIEPKFDIMDGNILMLWTDSAALFDLNSDKLLNKKEVATGYADQKVDFIENGVGRFRKDPECDDCSVILERYDSKLNLIDSLDMSKVFDIRADLLRPVQCALSKSGAEVVCVKVDTFQVLSFDLNTKEQKVVFDFSRANLSEAPSIEAIKIVGNDKFLAFTADDGPGFAYGLIDLENSQLVVYSKWDAIGDDIQAANNSVYFHEQYRGPWFLASGKIFRIDLNTLEKQTIQLADNDESQYVTVSENGKYIVTIRNSADPAADYTAGLLKVYDGQTMQVIRQIDLARGFPNVVIDEANHFLIAFYWEDAKMKLVRYVF